MKDGKVLTIDVEAAAGLIEGQRKRLKTVAQRSWAGRDADALSPPVYGEKTRLPQSRPRSAQAAYRRAPSPTVPLWTGKTSMASAASEAWSRIDTPLSIVFRCRRSIVSGKRRDTLHHRSSNTLFWDDPAPPDPASGQGKAFFIGQPPLAGACPAPRQSTSLPPLSSTACSRSGMRMPARPT